MTDPCSPEPGTTEGTFECHARDSWFFDATDLSADVPSDLRSAVTLLSAILADHDRAHPQPKTRRVRSAVPKFRAGLGMAPGTRITHAEASTSPA